MIKWITLIIVIIFIVLLFCGCNKKIKIVENVQETKATDKEKVIKQESKMSKNTLTIKIDDEVIDNNDVFKVIEPLWYRVSIYDGEEKYNRDLKKFSNAQKYVLAIEWYLSEVYNGGHDQFYFNSTGIVWEDAMKGFEVIGLKENYEIIKESAKRIGGNPNKDRSKRQDDLEKYNPDFSDLDSRLYEIKDIESGLIKYIKENRKDFYFEDIVDKS